jgi:hypothetical protein
MSCLSVNCLSLSCHVVLKKVSVGCRSVSCRSVSCLSVTCHIPCLYCYIVSVAIHLQRKMLVLFKNIAYHFIELSRSFTECN